MLKITILIHELLWVQFIFNSNYFVKELIKWYKIYTNPMEIAKDCPSQSPQQEHLRTCSKPNNQREKKIVTWHYWKKKNKNKCTLVCLISIPVCLFILDKTAEGYSYYFENILTITLFLINEIQIFFLLCTILTKSFNLIIILLFYDNCFKF